MNFPSKVTVQVTPVPPLGLAVRILFGMSKKNDFSYTIFVGNDGLAEISAEELLTKFDATSSFSLMDYADPRANFSGKITAEVLSNSDLQRAIEAFEMFRGYFKFPADYEQNLRAAVCRGQNPEDYCVVVHGA